MRMGVRGQNSPQPVKVPFETRKAGGKNQFSVSGKKFGAHSNHQQNQRPKEGKEENGSPK